MTSLFGHFLPKNDQMTQNNALYPNKQNVPLEPVEYGIWNTLRSNNTKQYEYHLVCLSSNRSNCSLLCELYDHREPSWHIQVK